MLYLFLEISDCIVFPFLFSKTLLPAKPRQDPPDREQHVSAPCPHSASR